MAQTAYQFKEHVIENLDALIRRKESDRPNMFHMLKHFSPEQLQEIRRFVNSFDAELEIDRVANDQEEPSR